MKVGITLGRTNKFNREYKKFVRKQPARANQLVKILDYFVHNPYHPSLNLEKLGGTEIWSIRIDRGNRVFFIWKSDWEVLLIDVGKHDKYREY